MGQNNHSKYAACKTSLLLWRCRFFSLLSFLQPMDFQISFLNLLAGSCTKQALLQWEDPQWLRIIPIFLFSEKEMKIWFKWSWLKFPLISSYAEKYRRHPSEITKNTIWWWRLQFKETKCPGNRSLTFSRFRRVFFSLSQQRNYISLYLVSREFFFREYWWIITINLYL